MIEADNVILASGSQPIELPMAKFDGERIIDSWDAIELAEVPPRVEYDVTAFGRSLEPILTVMQDWGRAFKARRLAEEAESERTADVG